MVYDFAGFHDDTMLWTQKVKSVRCSAAA